MTGAPEGPGKRRRTILAAVGLIVLLEVAAAVYFNSSVFAGPQGPSITFIFPTSSTSKSTTKTTTSTGPPPNSVVVKSALIFNDTLSLDVKNTGTDWTSSLAITGICTPNLAACYSYQTLSGSSLKKLFVLAPKGEFVENITGICVVPISSCTHYRPVVNFSYYYAVTFGFANGGSTTLPLVVKANNTYTLTPKFNNTANVWGLAYQLDTFPKNGTGRLTVSILVNDSLYAGNFTESLYTRVGKAAFTTRLLYNVTGCGGSLSQDCSIGMVNGTTNFPSVQTGIGTPYFPLPYLLSIRDLTVRGTVYFAVWVSTLDATVSK